MMGSTLEKAKAFLKHNVTPIQPYASKPRILAQIDLSQYISLSGSSYKGVVQEVIFSNTNNDLIWIALTKR